jgi:hypothetical protein
MNDRELMQQALDALNNSVDLVREDAYNAEELYGNYPTRQRKVGGLKVLADDHEKAITALRDRLAQPEQELVIDCPRCGHCCPQRQWVGLTDEELRDIAGDGPDYFDWKVFGRAIEAKLKEKNT